MTASILPLHPAATWENARAQYQQATTMAEQTVEAFALVGDTLRELKNVTEHGEFQKRCAEMFGETRIGDSVLAVSQRKASNYMRLSEHRAVWVPQQPSSLTKALKMLPTRAYKTSTKTKRPKSFRIGWPELLVQRLGLSYTMFRGGQGMKVRQALNPPSHFTDEAAAEAFVLAYVAAFPNAPAKVPELSDTAQQKLERAIAIKAVELDRDFNKRVYAEVDRRMPEFVAEREQFRKDNEEETARYHLLNLHTKKMITEADFRKLLFTLHSDRARCPHCGESLDYTELVQIIMKLKDYAEA